MNKQFLDYIRSLTKTDKKTLSQKALKTAEEVGELAKVVLPYDNAYATNHRFVERERILEEAMDTLLCALSIAYELGFSDEEVDEMLMRKAEKWAMLQAKEQDLKYPVPYEIHITVQIDPHRDADHEIDIFKKSCTALGVKPIVIDLQKGDGESVMHDVMTSSKHFGDNSSAYQAARAIATQLQASEFNVVRTKIETVPWHPAAPKFNNEQMPKDCYFESHLAVTLPDEKELDRLRTANKFGAFGLHISQNVFKRMDDGKFVIMGTYRAYTGTTQQFIDRVQHIKQRLEDIGFTVGKPITEFAVYDTKVSHDASWLNN